MARVLLLCVFLSFQILQCQSEEDPSVGEYFLEAVDFMNRTRWRFFLPEDADIDQDGNLSDLEVQHKFNTYMGEVFKLIDDDKDNSITEEEFRSLKLDIPHLTKVVDIALENFPLRPFFLAADGNGDGVYDENDFYTSEGPTPYTDVRISYHDHEVVFSRHPIRNYFPVANIGQNEGTVICKSKGHRGLERVVTVAELYSYTGTTPRYNLDVFSFSCNGTEARLEDCQKSFGNRGRGMGVICKDGKSEIDQGLSELIKWQTQHDWEFHTQRVWEEGGRFLFLADANGDGKLTLEELASKGKELVTKILEFLDENQDGKISLEDINLHLSVGPIQNLVLELFDDVTVGQGEFDIYNMKVAGRDMTKILGRRTFEDLDSNGDEKVNTADVFQYLRPRSTVTYLIPLVSQKLDKNQDGKIQREELRQFIDDMFNEVDMDKDGALTLEDAYILLRENGLNCLQVGALRSYIKVFLDTIDTITRDFFGYVFHQFDIDGNGQISTTELVQMHIPCSIRRYGSGNYVTPRYGYGDYRYYTTERSRYGSRDYGYYTTERPRYGSRNYGYYTSERSRYGSRNYGYYTSERPRYGYNDYGSYTSERSMDYDYNSNDDSADPNARKECGDMYQTFFGNKIDILLRSFPNLDMGSQRDSGHGRGGPGQRHSSSFYAHSYMGILENNMIERTCEMLT